MLDSVDDYMSEDIKSACEVVETAFAHWDNQDPSYYSNLESLKTFMILRIFVKSIY